MFSLAFVHFANAADGQDGNVSNPLQPVADDAVVTTFLREHCIRCHGPDDDQGEFRIDRDLTLEFSNLAIQGKWGEVVNVLNSHEMPPEGEPQPDAASVARVVDWVTEQMIAVERSRRDSAITIRRMNRDEYRNTIRDLVGVDYDTSHFPQDPPTAGFDNNGGALTVSPLHLELYYDAARTILASAFVEGDAPPTMRWRFEPDSGDSDSNRVEYDGQRLIVNGGKSRVENGFVVMHHASWDRTINVRDFRLQHPGTYTIRIRAAGVIPNRDAVVAGAAKYLAERRDKDIAKQPDRADRFQEQYEQDLEHFRTDRMYDYGPPRVKVIRTLGGQPTVIAEFDIDAMLDSPKTYEIETKMTTESAGITIEYVYHVPRELENFWMQTGDDFARPEAWIDWMELEGPVHDQWPPESQRKLLFDSPLRETDELGYATAVVKRTLQRAYRRPASEDEVKAKVALFQQARSDGQSFLEAIRLPLSAILVSPHFLYLTEPEFRSTNNGVAADGRNPRSLNPFELATRLSYFLWSSMPDDELFRVAASGRLRDPSVLETQVNRMLADKKGDAFVTNFAGQWLGLREVGQNPPAADLYRRYDRHLEVSMVKESLEFFREVLVNDLDAMQLISSDFVVINECLARFYGIPGVKGDHFRRVAVPQGVHRGGVLTQASVLTITSNGTRTSPVKRGTWVLKNILGTDPGLPVANAGEIAPKVPGIDKATVRKRLEIHRELAQCARCHNKIDPLGFALENFDASGDWREREGHGYQGRIGKDDPLIDASSQLPDGTEINGIEGLQQALLAKEELFLRCLAEKMFVYALGRELSIADTPHRQLAVDKMKSEGNRLRSLILAVVMSEPFQRK